MLLTLTLLYAVANWNLFFPAIIFITDGSKQPLQVMLRDMIWSMQLATQTASATHAWMEVFVPGVGWRGLDPTHNRQTDETYVKIAVGRDYADVPPLTGNYKGTLERKMEVAVNIRPVGERGGR